jgi:hypothetical protein
MRHPSITVRPAKSPDGERDLFRRRRHAAVRFYPADKAEEARGIYYPGAYLTLEAQVDSERAPVLKIRQPDHPPECPASVDGGSCNAAHHRQIVALDLPELMALQALATVEIIRENEDQPVRGNVMSSGDADADKAEEDRVLADLEANEWAWCVVKVTATWAGFHGESSWLGGCSYRSREDYIRSSDYYNDQVREALEDLKAQIEKAGRGDGASRVTPRGPRW